MRHRIVLLEVAFLLIVVHAQSHAAPFITHVLSHDESGREVLLHYDSSKDIFVDEDQQDAGQHTLIHHVDSSATKPGLATLSAGSSSNILLGENIDGTRQIVSHTAPKVTWDVPLIASGGFAPMPLVTQANIVLSTPKSAIKVDEKDAFPPLAAGTYGQAQAQQGIGGQAATEDAALSHSTSNGTGSTTISAALPLSLDNTTTAAPTDATAGKANADGGAPLGPQGDVEMPGPSKDDVQKLVAGAEQTAADQRQQPANESGDASSAPPLPPSPPVSVAAPPANATTQPEPPLDTPAPATPPSPPQATRTPPQSTKRWLERRRVIKLGTKSKSTSGKENDEEKPEEEPAASSGSPAGTANSTAQADPAQRNLSRNTESVRAPQPRESASAVAMGRVRSNSSDAVVYAKRVLESHGFDAKLVGNGENKTYHGHEVHNNGDGPNQDAHTVKIDDAPATKKADVPDSTVVSGEAATPSPTATNSNTGNRGLRDNDTGKKDGKGGKRQKRKGGAAKGGPPPPPPAPASPNGHDDRNERSDRDDKYDSHAEGDDQRTRSPIDYWDGHSAPGHEAEAASGAHSHANGAADALLLPAFPAMTFTSTAAICAGTFVVFVL